MPIFQDSNGLAVKFFLQKDLPQETQAELCETITALGGRVEQKIPRQGYILVQPGTAEEERLRLCWTSSDRPERHFVPYTYVDACKVAGMLLKQIFTENGVPMGMHIHPSIANVNARGALSQRIMHSGGDPYASTQSARVILADPYTEVFDHLVKTYQGVPDKFVESYLWVKKSIERGCVVFTPVVYKNPGGRRPGEERTQFTEDDEEKLCHWVASKIPYKETGGRTGNRLYQQLCEKSGDPEYAWVTRHTWQSWRERYKKNAFRLDRTIADIVEQNKPLRGEKGQIGYVRQAEEPVRRRGRARKATEQPPSGSPWDGMDQVMVESRDNEGLKVATPVVKPKGEPSSAPQKEEELDDEEDDEWKIKIGNDNPPAWAKRKIPDSEEEDNGEGRLKKRKIDPAGTSALINRSLREVAKEFKFTFGEVLEYYNKHGSVGRCRERFQEMRQVLKEKFPDM